MLPLLSIDAMTVAPYLKTNFPPDSKIEKLLVATDATVPFALPVPPLAVGTMPVKLTFGVVPPEDAKGDEAVTAVTVPPLPPDADSVPPENVRLEPMATLLNPPDPLPYRIEVPEVAGA
jgi:hypothetical protein